ncbi:hypothetical protein ACVWZK_008611 [Bradyrhizobium sp. GM0.4]
MSTQLRHRILRHTGCDVLESSPPESNSPIMDHRSRLQLTGLSNLDREVAAALIETPCPEVPRLFLAEEGCSFSLPPPWFAQIFPAALHIFGTEKAWRSAQDREV